MLSDTWHIINIVKIIIVVSILSFTPIIYAQEISKKKVCTVINVIDGDTVSVFFEGQEENIKLIGIDTLESWENEKVIRDSQRYEIEVDEMIALGNIATTFVEILVKPGDTLIIEFDKQTRDEYGRLLILNIGGIKPLVLADNEHYSSELLDWMFSQSPFEMLVPVKKKEVIEKVVEALPPRSIYKTLGWVCHNKNYLPHEKQYLWILLFIHSTQW